MGAHTRRCECGHITQVRYNSCRHRSCPFCSGGRRSQWLEQFSKSMLPCEHVHVIFTVPEELNVLWQYNRRLFGDLLMRAARESLLGLLADPKYLGAQPGILSALHTWGRNLSIHPHAHCLVTAGGLNPDGEFIHQKRKTLLPARVLMSVFRGAFCRLLRRAVQCGELELPTGTRPSQVQSLLNRLGRKPWNVRVQERYRHGFSVAGYLARYITGGPVSKKRIHSVSDSHVAFRYRDFRSGKQRIMKLTPFEFLRRWLEHVPPRGMRLIRRSGLYANCHADLRARISREASLDLPSTNNNEIAIQQERCPECKSIVQTVELFRPRKFENAQSQPEALHPGQPP